MPYATLQSKISVNDCIAFEAQCCTRLGIVIDESFENVEVLIFEKVTSEISKQHSLKPVTAAVYPMAYHGQMQEVICKTTDTLSVPQRSIVDIVFIIPITEVESGMFHIAGSQSVYFMRHLINNHGEVTNCNPVLYFSHCYFEPFSHRIFSSLNYIAQNLKRVMHHMKESDVAVKTFRIYVPMEAFTYLCYKVPHAIKKNSY
jgi:hypothetical protein